jgi:endonuclease YncB( thermonuclease family)
MAPHRTPFLLLAAMLLPTIVCAADFSGRVVGVIDGDTLEVLHHNKAERIRLSGIDCPEKGNKAKELVFGKEVTLRCGFRL